MTRRQSNLAESNYLITYRAIEEGLEVAIPPSVLLINQTKGRVDRFVARAQERGVKVERVSRAELRQRAGPDARDCALLLRTEKSGAPDLTSFLDGVRSDETLVLLLDRITDPHNFGAILRSADQFQVDAVITPTRRSAGVTNVVIQSSAGTAGRVPIIPVMNLAAAIEPLKSAGFWIFGADMDGTPVHRASLTGKVAIILGSEGSGVARLLRDRADGLVRIPARGHADSFNVSVACGILLYEVRRQQGWLDL